MKFKHITYNILFFFFILSLASYAQSTAAIDSLKLILKKTPLADSTKAKTLVALAWEIKYDNVSEAEKTAKEGIELSKKNKPFKRCCNRFKDTWNYK